MPVSKKQLTCIHSFQATNRKSVLKVESISRGIKGKTTKIDICATIFKCSKCGAQEDYPDYWEQGFRILPLEKVLPV